MKSDPVEDHIEPLEVASEALQPAEPLLMDPQIAGLVVLVTRREPLMKSDSRNGWTLPCFFSSPVRTPSAAAASV
jgi:hypothetical protein